MKQGLTGAFASFLGRKEEEMSCQVLIVKSTGYPHFPVAKKKDCHSELNLYVFTMRLRVFITLLGYRIDTLDKV